LRRRSFLALSSLMPVWARAFSETSVTSSKFSGATPLVFKIVGDGRTNYLMPSIHAGLSKADLPPPPFKKFVGERSALYIEADVRNTTLMSQLLDEYASTSDNHLREKIPANIYSIIVRRLSLIGIPEANVSKMRPWMIGSALPTVRLPLTAASIAAMPRPEFGAEPMLIAAADQAKTPVRELEGLEHQFIALSGQAPEDEFHVLEDWVTMVEDGRAQAFQEAVIAGWRTGDLTIVDAAVAALEKSNNSYARYYTHQVIGERNASITTEIAHTCAMEDNVLMAVGIEHFVRADGFATQLPRLGLSVERVQIA
jgi:uncharacterized protein YbaP (TraB family)